MNLDDDEYEMIERYRAAMVVADKSLITSSFDQWYSARGADLKLSDSYLSWSAGWGAAMRLMQPDLQRLAEVVRKIRVITL